MKYVVLFLVLWVVWMVWSASKRRDAAARTAARRQAQAASVPQDMVRCPVCALHLPRADALPGRSGRLYCSREHQAAGGN